MKRWCSEAETIADNFDIDEMMMMISDNYEGDGEYDALAIGKYIVKEYESALEVILEAN